MTNKQNWPSGITRWDCIFLFSEEYLDSQEFRQWQDVENMIFNVISLVLWSKETHKSFRPNLKFKKTQESELDSKIIFTNMVNTFSESETDTLEQKADNLLHDLNKFEEEFAKYINECAIEEVYKSKAKDLLRVLAGWNTDKTNQLDVLSFNYSLDPRFGQQLKEENKFPLNTWTNIHGLASYSDTEAASYINRIQKTFGEDVPAPIFGIDNHDILEDNFGYDLRLLFTKS